MLYAKITGRVLDEDGKKPEGPKMRLALNKEGLWQWIEEGEWDADVLLLPSEMADALLAAIKKGYVLDETKLDVANWMVVQTEQVEY